MQHKEYRDFIGLYEGVYPDGYCRHMIDEFERLSNTGATYNRQHEEGCLKRIKQDEFTFLNFKNHTPTPFNGDDAKDIFFRGLQECYEDYVAEYDILRDLNVKCTNIKLQKTKPGEGYHVWHCEQGTEDGANRCVVYALYLNTITEAGETEYLYQKMRVQPRENVMVLWPAGYTHPHRGNAVYGNDAKYIITGWFYLE
tara:strand:- start:8306 stop:8899 length:594 start_codon:yes stop_codon:yes gene_type:complete